MNDKEDDTPRVQDGWFSYETGGGLRFSFFREEYEALKRENFDPTELECVAVPDGLFPAAKKPAGEERK